MRETSLGLVPDLGGTHVLADLVGYSRALEICITGRWVGAAEARNIGLATIVVPRDELEDTVSDLVAAVTAAPHDAVTGTKALLRSAGGRGYDDQLAAERAAQVKRIRALAAAFGGHN
jgi:enoyl-CoA hydratase/carnithine racemase